MPRTTLFLLVFILIPAVVVSEAAAQEVAAEAVDALFAEWDKPDSPGCALAVIDDVIWYNESAMRPDTLVRFDPATEEFQSWAIPSGAGIIRNMWVTEAGDLLIHQSSSNRFGLVTIDDGPTE